MTNKTELMQEFEDAYSSFFQFPTNKKDFAFSNNNYHLPYVNYSWLSYQAATEKLIEQLTKERETIEQLRSELESLKKAQQWVSVDDELPDENKKVIVYVSRLGYYPDYLDTSFRQNGSWREHRGVWQRITHWMPLPLAPEGEI